jgi:tetrapyrrole methylase family protein/MazG family protein
MAANFERKASYKIEDLRKIMALLRSADGCPWDREQTHQSIRMNLIEETYEAVEAIDTNNSLLLREELGDIMLQVVFHAQMSEETGDFDLDDVADGICKKLILRHPHIFGDVVMEDAEGVLDQWEAIKRVEKQQETFTETLKDVSTVLPALMRAGKLIKRAEKAGLSYGDATAALSDTEMLVDKLRAALIDGNGDPGHCLGDLLLNLTAVARLGHLDAEEQLSFASERFINHFAQTEALSAKRGTDMNALPKAELCQIWQNVLAGFHNKKQEE